MRPIVRVLRLGKRYRVGHRQPFGSLRERLTNQINAPLRLLRSRGTGSNGVSKDADHVWALHDLSFDVQPGEILGLIGSNGAGKSTLLKILSRITHPTRGRAELYGRVRSLLEVGTGFHPELTGRENVFLNGAILGMHRAETAQKFDEIVAFAEVEKFIDTPVKHYSSGMYVRLAFSVAAHLEPEILLVDEVLAVGDARFWSKSMVRMRELNRRGTTIVLVTHNMWLVQTIASRAMWLRKGQIAGYGDPLKVIGLYRQASEEADGEGPAKNDDGETVRIKNLRMFPESRWASKDEALPNSGVKLVFTVEAESGSKLKFLVRITSPDNLPYFTVYSEVTEIPRRGRVVAEARIARLMLMPGDYRAWVAVCSEAGEDQMLAHDSVALKVISEGEVPPSFNLLWNEGEWLVRNVQ